MRWLISQRGLQPPAASKVDEEQPLLSASWEHPTNNKALHASKAGTGYGSGGGGSSDGAPEGATLQPSTVAELLRLSVPDTPLLLVAFVFGTAAALMSACVPYFTGQIIDYASIDPDR